jgi:hypothetical protein
MGEDVKPVQIVYGNMLPLAEMVSPEVPWKVGDRVTSKFGDGDGTIHNTEDFDLEQNVGVVFDQDPNTLAWMNDFDVYPEGS